jgi:hypothetical protein
MDAAWGEFTVFLKKMGGKGDAPAAARPWVVLKVVQCC